jgi:hypothetical protein
MLPPGLSSRSMMPVATGSVTPAKTIGQGGLTEWEDRRQRIAGRQRPELFRAPGVEVTGAEYDGTNALLRKSCEGWFEIVTGSGIHNNELQAQCERRRL